MGVNGVNIMPDFADIYLRNIPYQQETKREQREHLISPDMVTTESLSALARQLRSSWILEYIKT